MLRFLAVLHAYLAFNIAFAGTALVNSSMVWGDTAKITTTAINAACVSDAGNDDTPTCASFELDTRGFRDVCLVLRYVKGAATDVRMFKDDSITGDVPWGVLQLGNASSPPAVSEADHYAVWDTSGMAGAAGKSWSVCFGVTAPYTRFRFTSTAGNTSDKMTVYYILVGR